MENAGQIARAGRKARYQAYHRSKGRGDGDCDLNSTARDFLYIDICQSRCRFPDSLFISIDIPQCPGSAPALYF
jgi:hypothetical protein